MDKDLNNYKYISVMLEITAVYCFIEFYIAEYFWKGLYSISAIVYLLIFLWLGFEVFYRSKELKVNPKYLYYFLMICLASFLINFSSFTGLIFYIKTYLFPFLILYWVKQSNSKRFLKIIISLFLLNIILNTGWLLRLNPLPNIYKNTLDDFAIGTVGTAFFAFISIIFILYGYIYKRKLVWLLAGFALLISNSLALFGIFLPVMLSATKFRVKHYIGFILAIIALIFSFSYLMPDVYHFTTNRLEIVSSLQFAKLELYTEMFEDFSNEPLKLLTGFGPGERSSFASERIGSEYYNNNITYFSETLYVEGGSVMDKYYSGFASIFWENGIVGLICLVMLFKKFMLSKNLSKQERRLNIAFIVLFFLWSLVMDTFRHSNLSILYMMLAGILSNGIESQLVGLKTGSQIDGNNSLPSSAELRLN